MSNQQIITQQPPKIENLKLSLSKLKRRLEKTNIPDPYLEYLSTQKFDWFFTITAKHHLSIESCRRVAERFASSVQRYGSGSLAPEMRDGVIFWVCEPHKHAEAGFHLHGLYRKPFPRFAHWGNKDEFKMLKFEARKACGGDEWVNKSGEMGLWHRVRFEPYRGKTGADYCVKYLNKYLSDYDFLPIKQRF